MKNLKSNSKVKKETKINSARKNKTKNKKTTEKTHFEIMLGAMCYLFGMHKEAFKFFSKSAKEGNVEAYHQLGAMYYVGRGVKKNHKKAFVFYLKAAEKGHVFAQNMLGIMYYKGQGTDKNDEKAFYWLSKSAEKGNKHAKIYLKKYKLKKDNKNV